MTPPFDAEGLFGRRVDALAEVIHGVLLSLEELNHSARSTLRDNWRQVLAALEERLGGVVQPEEDARVVASHAEPPLARGAARPPRVNIPPPHESAPWPATSGEPSPDDDRGEPAPEPARPSNRASDPGGVSRSLLDAVYHDDSPFPEPPSPDDYRGEPSPEPDVDPDILRDLRERVQALEEENRRLRERLEATPRSMGRSGRGEQPGSNAISVAAVLRALGVEEKRIGPLSVEDHAAESLRKQLECLKPYFEKTVRDINEAFKHPRVQLPIEIEPLPERLCRALEAGEDISPYLDQVRYFWQGLFRAIVVNLEPWCKDAEKVFDPGKVQEQHRRHEEMCKANRRLDDRCKDVWDFYSRQVFPRVHLHDHLTEFLRHHIKRELRKRKFSLEG